MLTATDFGEPGVQGVVVGPLKHAFVSSRILQVSSGIKLGPPFLSHHSIPASHWINSVSVPVAFMTVSIASTSSGPVPSPLISATRFPIYTQDNSLLLSYRRFSLSGVCLMEALKGNQAQSRKDRF